MSASFDSTLLMSTVVSDYPINILALLVKAIEETGGLTIVRNEVNDTLYMTDDFDDGFGEEWPALADVYLMACKALSREPLIVEAVADDDEEEDEIDAAYEELAEVPVEARGSLASLQEVIDDEFMAILTGECNASVHDQEAGVD